MRDLRVVPLALVQLTRHQHRASRRKEVIDHPADPQPERSARGVEVQDVAERDPEVVRQIGRHDCHLARRHQTPHIGHSRADQRPALEPRVEEEARVDRVDRDRPAGVMPVARVLADDHRDSGHLFDLP